MYYLFIIDKCLCGPDLAACRSLETPVLGWIRSQKSRATEVITPEVSWSWRTTPNAKSTVHKHSSLYYCLNVSRLDLLNYPCHHLMFTLTGTFLFSQNSFASFGVLPNFLTQIILPRHLCWVVLLSTSAEYAWKRDVVLQRLSFMKSRVSSTSVTFGQHQQNCFHAYACHMVIIEQKNLSFGVAVAVQTPESVADLRMYLSESWFVLHRYIDCNCGTSA